MSEEVIEEELLELPGPFRGLPYRTKANAYAAARAMLPSTVTRVTLGEDDFEEALINAAAHWLESNNIMATSMFDETQVPRRQLGGTSASAWRTTPYGDIVAGILDRLSRRSGRGRRLFG